MSDSTQTTFDDARIDELLRTTLGPVALSSRRHERHLRRLLAPAAASAETEAIGSVESPPLLRSPRAVRPAVTSDTRRQWSELAALLLAIATVIAVVGFFVRGGSLPESTSVGDMPQADLLVVVTTIGVALVDIDTGDVLDTIDAPFSPDAAVSPDGSTVFVVGVGDHTQMAAIDIATGAELWRVPVPNRLRYHFGFGPSTLAVSPDGSEVLLMMSGVTGTYWIEVFDARTGGTLRRSNGTPGGCRFHGGGEDLDLFATCGRLRRVNIYRRDTRAYVDFIELSGTPFGSIVAPDGTTLYVVTDNYDGYSIAVIDMPTRTLIDEVLLGSGDHPHPQRGLVALSPDGSRLHIGISQLRGGPVSDENQMLVSFDTATWTEVGRVTAPEPMSGLWIGADDEDVIYYLTRSDGAPSDSFGNLVQRFDTRSGEATTIYRAGVNEIYRAYLVTPRAPTPIAASPTAATSDETMTADEALARAREVLDRAVGAETHQGRFISVRLTYLSAILPKASWISTVGDGSNGHPDTPVWEIEADGLDPELGCDAAANSLDCRESRVVVVLNAETGAEIGLRHPDAGITRRTPPDDIPAVSADAQFATIDAAIRLRITLHERNEPQRAEQIPRVVGIWLIRAADYPIAAQWISSDDPVWLLLVEDDCSPDTCEVRHFVAVVDPMDGLPVVTGFGGVHTRPDSLALREPKQVEDIALSLVPGKEGQPAWAVEANTRGMAISDVWERPSDYPGLDPWTLIWRVELADAGYEGTCPADTSRNSVCVFDHVVVILDTASGAVLSLRGDPTPVPAATPTPGVTPSPSPPGVPVPAVGEPYPSNPAFAAADITLVRTDTQPVNAQDQILRAIADLGVPWALGGEWEGKPVTIQSYYGLATQGFPGVNGMAWEGFLNIPLPNGVMLNHIENRSMWIIDYGNTQFADSGCPDCPVVPAKNHSVYLIDDETGTVLLVWGYAGP